MTYEENVRKAAKEMAIAHCNEESLLLWDSLPESAREVRIEAKALSARISVRRESEAFKAGYALSEIEPIWGNNPSMDQYLIDRGLIPATEVSQSTINKKFERLIHPNGKRQEDRF